MGEGAQVRDGEAAIESPATPFVGSRLAMVLALFLGVLSLVAFVRAGNTPPPEEAFAAAECAIAREWRSKYPDHQDLQVTRVEVIYRGEAANFVKGEGFVSVPVALDLLQAQKILELRGLPKPARLLEVEGVTNFTWDYAGRVMRDMRFVALALVKRPRASPAALPEAPTFERLRADVRAEASLPARETEEHRLHECRAFPGWVKEVAGDPPYTDQVLRIARYIAPKIVPNDSKKEIEDVCAGIRDDVFKAHHAHVATVMAARELGVPAYGFVAAERRHKKLVGLYVDGQGWVTFDVEKPAQGYSLGGSALVAKAPTLVDFEATSHDFWYGYGIAFSPSTGYFGLRGLSYTTWLPDDEEKDSDNTRVTSRLLAEVCP